MILKLKLSRKVSAIGKFSYFSFNIIFILCLTFIIFLLILNIIVKINVTKYLYFFFFIIILMIYFWVYELYNNKNYSKIVYKNYITGFLLFLVSEVLIFFSIFWSWFHMSLIPYSNYGGLWPLINFPEINWYGLAFYNTLILFISSCFINYWEVSIKTKIKNTNNLYFLLWVIFLGLHFLLTQFIEYSRLPISFNDSINSVLFFSITGLHLLHVVIGLIFLILAFIKYSFSLNFYNYFNYSVNIKITCFYWHFVDIMWILVFLIVYII